MANYDPICHEQCTGVSGVVGAGVIDLGSVSSLKGETFEAYRVDRLPGNEFSFWFSLSIDTTVYLPASIELTIPMGTGCQS